MTATSNSSEQLREQGNQAFKQGKFQEAIDRYTDALDLLTDQQLSDGIKNELTKCYSNRSQCYLNLNQYEEAIEDATRGKSSISKTLISSSRGLFLALEYTPADQKSLYRRANAFERIGKLNEAVSDAQRLISVSSKGNSVDEQTNILLRKLRENVQSKVMANNTLFLFNCSSLIFCSILNKRN